MCTDSWRQAQKRHGPFSAADFGDAVCKRLRGARLSLLARIDAGATCALLPSQVCRRPALAEDSKRPSTLARLSQPGDLNADLLRPLPPATARRLASAPMGGKLELWDVTRPAPTPQPTRANPMSYLDYLSWLQKVLPESMAPAGTAEKAASEEEEIEGHEHLSALDLLRRISFAAKPPPPARRSHVPSLTAEEREVAEKSLDDGADSEVLVSRFNVDVTRKQLACLKPAQWLNDEVINFYCKLLEERSKKSKDAPKCWFPNSFFWPKLSGAGNSNYSYKDVRRWTIKAKVDIFELDYIIFPMNIGESHWTLGAIDLKEKGFRYFDSMSCRPYKNFAPFLRQYLQDEHKAKKGKPLEGVDDWGLIIPESPIPQQDNGYDCGVFTCFFADCFSAGRRLGFEQEDMPDLRLRLVARVVSGREDWDID